MVTCECSNTECKEKTIQNGLVSSYVARFMTIWFEKTIDEGSMSLIWLVLLFFTTTLWSITYIDTLCWLITTCMVVFVMAVYPFLEASHETKVACDEKGKTRAQPIPPGTVNSDTARDYARESSRETARDSSRDTVRDARRVHTHDNSTARGTDDLRDQIVNDNSDNSVRHAENYGIYDVRPGSSTSGSYSIRHDEIDYLLSHTAQQHRELMGTLNASILSLHNIFKEFRAEYVTNSRAIQNLLCENSMLKMTQNNLTQQLNHHGTERVVTQDKSVQHTPELAQFVEHQRTVDEVTSRCELQIKTIRDALLSNN